ncbi:MAG: hypothetical protein Q4C61_07155, partial [Lachnospiraceae bacterium]|nr:hypothetical protein [Lachnospiraceae bacterium]
MKNQYSFLTRADGKQNQQTFDDPNLRIFLNEQHVTNEHRLKNDLMGFFLSSWSFCRSYLFMNFRFRKQEYTTYMGKDIGEFIPVYGVKGAVGGLARDTKYVSLTMSGEEDILGAGFNEYIFGMQYISEAEARDETDPAVLLRRKEKKVDYTIAPDRRRLVSRILEKLWEAQEQDPATRFIILLEDAENRSMELLRELYLLIPQKLRLQLGFETNIIKADLDVVNQHGLPIHILTMERSEYSDMSRLYGFPIAVFDVEQQDQYAYDPVRLRTLEQMAEHMQRPMTFCLGYAEKKVMEQKEIRGSDFCFYQEILNMLGTPELYWWEKKTYSGIAQLYRDYCEQAELMAEPVLEKEAIGSFYMNIVPQSGLASEIAMLVKNQDAPNRTKYLDFLEQCLYYGREIGAAEELITLLKEEKETALAQEEERARKKEQQMLEEQQKREQQAQEEHQKQKQQALQEQQEKLQRRFEDEKQQCVLALEKEHTEKQRTLEEERDSWKKDCDKLEALKAALEQENLELEEQLRRYEEEDAFLQIRSLEDELAAQKNKLEEAKKETGNVSKSRTIFLATTVVLAIIAAVGIAAAVMFMKSANTAIQDRTSYESELKAAQEKNAELDENVKALESERDEAVKALEEAKEPDTTGQTGTTDGTGTSG